MHRFWISTSLILSTSVLALGQNEAPAERVANYDQLKVLEPFLGRWVYEGPVLRTIPGFLEKGKQIRVEMNYQWVVDRNAIVLNITITPQGAKAYKIIEMIGWDVRRQRIVSGAFNSAGGMTYGQWKRDENRLLVETRDVAHDGTESSSTIVHELHGDDALSWSETNRIVDGESRPDTPGYEFRRVKQPDKP